MCGFFARARAWVIMSIPPTITAEKQTCSAATRRSSLKQFRRKSAQTVPSCVETGRRGKQQWMGVATSEITTCAKTHAHTWHMLRCERGEVVLGASEPYMAKDCLIILQLHRLHRRPRGKICPKSIQTFNLCVVGNSVLQDDTYHTWLQSRRPKLWTAQKFALLTPELASRPGQITSAGCLKREIPYLRRRPRNAVGKTKRMFESKPKKQDKMNREWTYPTMLAKLAAQMLPFCPIPSRPILWYPSLQWKTCAHQITSSFKQGFFWGPKWFPSTQPRTHPPVQQEWLLFVFLLDCSTSAPDRPRTGHPWHPVQ